MSHINSWCPDFFQKKVLSDAGVKFTLSNMTSFLPDNMSGIKKNISRPEYPFFTECEITFVYFLYTYIWVKIFKEKPSKICGRLALQNLKWHGLLRQTIFSPLQIKIYSWIENRVVQVFTFQVCYIYDNKKWASKPSQRRIYYANWNVTID